ncbi:MAG: hypothetical protein NW226_04190 [Microscillaceae bacterium]|nr:hypothetical protein [Microscillaceae bacterium]
MPLYPNELSCTRLVTLENNAFKLKTRLSIQGEKFYINGKPTYAGKSWQGKSIEGLLFNSRMVQGIFDDLNPESRNLWKYPDTQSWDPDRNTHEFVAAMESWKKHGLLAFTLNLQGGSPTGYGNKNWINSAFDPNGNLRPDYMNRLNKILQKADELGMVVILGYFYFGQDQTLLKEADVLQAVDHATDWLLEKAYQNILIEINNEADIQYDHDILKAPRVHELITRVKSKQKKGFRLLVSTSYAGGKIPSVEIIKNSDFVLLHGNGVSNPARISQMVDQVRQNTGYTPKPILFNEDDHYDFDKEDNNFKAAVKSYASWGFFDFRRPEEADRFSEGFQSIPVDWTISSERKKAFFLQLKEITGE